MLWYKPNFKKSKKLKEHVNKIWKHLTFADISHLFSYLNKRDWVFHFSQYDDEILTVHHFMRMKISCFFNFWISFKLIWFWDSSLNNHQWRIKNFLRETTFSRWFRGSCDVPMGPQHDGGPRERAKPPQALKI